MQRCQTCGYDRATGARCTQCGSLLPQPEAAARTQPSLPELGLWSLRHLGVGWSVYWRTVLLESLTALVSLILVPGKMGGALLPLVLSPLIHDWATKTVLRRRYGATINRFIGFQLSGALLFALIVLSLTCGVGVAGAFFLLLAHGLPLSPQGWTIAVMVIALATLTVPVIGYGYAAHTALRRRLGFELLGVLTFLISLAAILLRH
jgi:hypothetical protein